MKKITSLILLAGFSMLAWGQATNKIESTGNVGIGTTNPAEKLDVASDDPFTIQLRRITNGEWVGIRFDTNLATQYGWLRFTHYDNQSKTFGGASQFGASFQTGTSEGAGTGTLWQHSGALELYAPKNGWEKHITLTHIDKINYGRIIQDGDGMKFRSYNDKHFYFRNTANETSLFIHNNGNVGVGMSSSGDKLQIGANNNEGIYIGKYRDRLGWDGAGEQPGYHIRFAGYRDVAGAVTGARISALRTNICCSGLHQAMELAFYVNNGITQSSNGDVNLIEAMRIVQNGQVGIGTTTPSAKLDVAGNIKAHEIEVTLAAMQDLQLNGTLAANNITYTTNGNTADFVFEDNYHLKDLSEVEAFIKTNKHLPEIPSATEMEEAGVNLAEMNKLLLMKVEELTLYAIEQEKETEVLRDENRAMSDEMKRQDERLKKMEALLEELTLNLPKDRDKL